jgi:hypothetical protein
VVAVCPSAAYAIGPAVSVLAQWDETRAAFAGVR